jgi:hypothetical protein
MSRDPEDMDGVKAEVRALPEQLVVERAGFAYELRDIFEVQPTMADRDGPVARSTAAAIRRVCTDRRHGELRESRGIVRPRSAGPKTVTLTRQQR